MTAYEAMRRRAIEDFDRLVVEQERVIRATMTAAGRCRAEIDAYVESCQPSLEAQRREIGRMIVSAFAKNGIPVDTDAREWRA